MARKIFDVHSHIGSFGCRKIFGREIRPFEQPVATVEKYAGFIEKHNLTYALCLPNYSLDPEMPFRLNALILEAVKKLDNVFGAFWVSPVQETWALTEEILEKKLPPKIKALKLSASTWPEGLTPNPASWGEKVRENFESILAFAGKQKLALQFHTGSGNSDILEFEPFIEKYGSRQVIHLAHMGGSASGHFKFVPRFMEWLEAGFKVYCDTGFSRDFGPQWLLRELVKKGQGLERVMFASDYPWGLMEPALARIDCLDLEESLKEMVFFKNAKKLYLK